MAVTSKYITDKEIYDALISIRNINDNFFQVIATYGVENNILYELLNRDFIGKEEITGKNLWYKVKPLGFDFIKTYEAEDFDKKLKKRQFNALHSYRFWLPFGTGLLALILNSYQWYMQETLKKELQTTNSQVFALKLGYDSLQAQFQKHYGKIYQKDSLKN